MRVLFLDLDTLRPDHLGCYGYERNTSPTIDKIAEEGVRFENYYCSNAPCLPSRAALMSGRFGIHNGVVGHGGTTADMRIDGECRDFNDRLINESLWSLFREAGMKTVSISPFAERHSSWTFYAGFDEMHNTGKYGLESAEDVTPTVLKWIENNAKEDNWFLHVNYWDPHTPYRAPKEFGNPFENDPIPDWITEDIFFNNHRKHVGPHSAREIIMYHSNPNPKYPRHLGEIKDMNDLKTFMDGYDCGIRYMDEHIKSIFEALEKQGISIDDLTIIITADHGENLGELGLYAEHGTADNTTCKIPMIIKWPNCKKGHVDNGLHYNLDLAPTLSELFNIPPKARWDGRSYSKVITNGESCSHQYLILEQCAHVCQRAVRFDDWIYIRTYHDGYHLFPTEMLFNIKNDPHEQQNVAQENKAVCKEAVYYLNEWHDNMMMTMECDIDPLWTVIQEGGPYHAKGHLKEYCERLRATDRSDAIPELMKRHPREFK